MSAATQKIKVRGLARIVAWVLGVWGVLVCGKALYDLFAGEPEANLYSAEKWQFVTQAQWLRYGGFELAYGLACLALAWAAVKYARFLPEVVERARHEPDVRLFG